MKLGMLSDELSPVPEIGCELAALYGIKYLELRMWYYHRAPLGMTQKDMEGVRAAAEGWGVQYGSISPGLLKIPMESEERQGHVTDLFEKSLDLCETLGAGLMVSFTPIVPEERRGQWDGQLLEEFRAMGDQAHERGITIAIENEPVCVASSAPLVAKLVGEIAHPAVRMNWDPGNDAFSAQSTGPEAWPAVQPVLAHVHVKDYYPGKVQVADLGEGAADWRWILPALKEANYSGYLILEPHNRPQIASTMRAVMILRQRLAEAEVAW
jgi:sugar phosphate isomerase/epimerase